MARNIISFDWALKYTLRDKASELLYSAARV